MSYELTVGAPEKKWMLADTEDAEQLVEVLAAAARDGHAVDFATSDGTTIWLNPAALGWWYVSEYIPPTVY